MATRTVSGKPCLNTFKNKKSYLVLLSDTDGDYSKDTTVKVVDGKETLEWSGEVHQVSQQGKRAKVKLKCEKGHERKETDPPDGGSITVTLTMPTAEIMNVPVDYITDPT